MKTRRLFLGTTIAWAIGTLVEGKSMAQLMTHPAARLPVEGELPSLGGAIEWLNSPPLTPAGLRGKVVLIDFWTYTCINWLRTLPYVRAWADKYRDAGLVVVGVHSPVHAPPRQAWPVHVEGAPHCPVVLHVSTSLFEQRFVPGAHTPTHAPSTHA